ncbi:MAG TPA: HAMP domain-containing sensor histidine kinase [Kofleriaceae bacterium]|nr:HAMP domain-containing sensor histidine kinase [Kofleriaceae bacterium]
MRYPSFIAEMDAERHRSNLRMGVWSGYAMVVAFAALAMVGQLQGLVPWNWSYYALIGVKLATNTLALWALRRDRGVLETQGLNTVTDILVMTGAIYVTGGQASPLFPIYVILISVVALLSNLPITVITAAAVLVAYAAMALATFAGLLPQHPAPALGPVEIDLSYLLADLAFAAFVLGVPTLYTSLILKRLARKRRLLEQRNAELIEAGQQKSQFMANITHELRTPIHGICGLTELLESGLYGPVGDKQRKALDSIKRSARGQLHLVDELLTLSKADAGKLAVEPSEIELADLMDSVASAIRWMLGTKQMDLEVVLEDAPSHVVTDRGKLNQVLINILSNAAKFTPEGGRIEVVARAVDPDRFAIAVRDDGPGIPTDQLERIFEAFRQVDGSDEREYGGVGLGLSLVDRLVTLMGGTIEVASTLGVGTTFTLTLPRDLTA